MKSSRDSQVIADDEVELAECQMQGALEAALSAGGPTCARLPGPIPPGRARSIKVPPRTIGHATAPDRLARRRSTPVPRASPAVRSASAATQNNRPSMKLEYMAGLRTLVRNSMPRVSRNEGSAWNRRSSVMPGSTVAIYAMYMPKCRCFPGQQLPVQPCWPRHGTLTIYCLHLSPAAPIYRAAPIVGTPPHSGIHQAQGLSRNTRQTALLSESPDRGSEQLPRD